MKINGNTIIGLWKFQSNRSYTVGDLILHNDTLYVVKSNFTSSNELDLTKVKDYLEVHSYSETGNTANGVVTLSDFDQVLNRYIKGLNSDGSIQTINIDSSLDVTIGLPSYTETGIYHLQCNDGKEFIFKVYHINDIIIQEFTDMDTLSQYIIRVDGGNATHASYVIASNDTYRLDNIVSNMINIKRQLSELNNTFNFLSIQVDSDLTGAVPQRDLILHLLAHSSQDEQYSTEFFLDNVATGSVTRSRNLGSSGLASVERFPSSIKITLPTGVTLDKVYISNPYSE